MSRRMLILAAVLATATMTIAAGMAATSQSWRGAQTNLNQHKAVPKFVAPEPSAASGVEQPSPCP